MTREAELKARDFIALVAGGFGAESEIGVVQRLLLQAQTALVSYAEDQWAGERGWPLLVDALRFRLDTSPAGSDAQLTTVNALAASALPSSVLDRMRGWLLAPENNPDVPEGLTLDTDLRWRLLHALVAHGAAGEAEIDEELRRDPTSAGEQHAAEARAAVPTAEAKAEAWASVVEDDKLPNALQNAITGGFVQTDQRELLAPYTAKYFAAVKDVWEARSHESAQTIVIGLYPALQISQDTLDATDAWLASAAPVPALRRLVTESRDGVARALKAQAADAAASAA
jgi:aminopeptidase N